MTDVITISSMEFDPEKRYLVFAHISDPTPEKIERLRVVIRQALDNNGIGAGVVITTEPIEVMARVVSEPPKKAIEDVISRIVNEALAQEPPQWPST